ncbi:hypothetical protein [Dyella sp. EPa41]|uniref:hypothetical protein n=1 Tax=Dyella sp. EPa41 TaxID=1561194 RepID=UPI0019165B35|nr:hypothetical protein [Dyella sp. EPa41]
MKPLRSVLLLAASALAACSAVTVTNQWKDPSWAGPPVSNILVLGIAKSDTNRRLFEDTVAEQLHAAGVTAEESYAVIPVGGGSQDQLIELVKKSGAQALLATRVQRVEQKTNAMTSGPAYGRFYAWYGNAWSMSPELTQYDVVTLETSVWDLKTEKVIWSTTTENVSSTNIPQAARQLASTLIPKLKSDGVIR